MSNLYSNVTVTGNTGAGGGVGICNMAAATAPVYSSYTPPVVTGTWPAAPVPLPAITGTMMSRLGAGWGVAGYYDNGLGVPVATSNDSSGLGSIHQFARDCIDSSKASARKAGRVYFVPIQSLIKLFTSSIGKKLIGEYNKEIKWYERSAYHKHTDYIPQSSILNTYTSTTTNASTYTSTYAPATYRAIMFNKEGLPLSDALSILCSYKCMIIFRKEIGIQYEHACQSTFVSGSTSFNNSLMFPESYKDSSKDYTNVSFFRRHKYSQEWRVRTAILDIDKDYMPEITESWSKARLLADKADKTYDYSSLYNSYSGGSTVKSLSDRDGILLYGAKVYNEDKLLMAKIQYEM
jgi:hypothetical protein